MIIDHYSSFVFIIIIKYKQHIYFIIITSKTIIIIIIFAMCGNYHYVAQNGLQLFCSFKKLL